MVQTLVLVQITLAVLLIILIIVQRANTDATGALGQDGGMGSFLEKRGAEKVLHRATIIVAILFTLSLAYHLIA